MPAHLRGHVFFVFLPGQLSAAPLAALARLMAGRTAAALAALALIAPVLAVSAGGADLNEINPKTMEAKKYPHLYFIGECLNIDGLCGGFNLQNAWSTAFVAAEGIIGI